MNKLFIKSIEMCLKVTANCRMLMAPFDKSSVLLNDSTVPATYEEKLLKVLIVFLIS